MEDGRAGGAGGCEVESFDAGKNLHIYRGAANKTLRPGLHSVISMEPYAQVPGTSVLESNAHSTRPALTRLKCRGLMKTWLESMQRALNVSTLPPSAAQYAQSNVMATVIYFCFTGQNGATGHQLPHSDNLS